MICCPHCKLDFEDQKSCMKHILSNHNYINYFPCIYDSCKRSFSSVRALRKHCNTHVTTTQTLKTVAREPQMQNIANCEEVKIDNKIECADIEIRVIDKIIDKDQIVVVLNNAQTDETIDDTFSYSNKANKYDSTNEDILNIFRLKFMLFIAQLYSFPDVSRHRVNDIVKNMTEIFICVFETYESAFASQPDTINKVDILGMIKNLFQNFQEEFNRYSTEARAFKQFKDKKTLILPEKHCVAQELNVKDIQNLSIVSKSLTMEIIPIGSVLKLFFELPGVFNKTVEYMKVLESSSVIQNYIQGSLWTGKKKTFENKHVFPLFLFFDDFETNNPLGSHKGVSEVGGLYISIPSLPPELQPKIENIFIFSLFKSTYKKNVKMASIFYKIIDILNNLYTEGISININSKMEKIFFSTELILGDNLGLHSIFNYSKSFKSTNFCRFCCISHKDISTVLNEKQCIMRDKPNYKLSTSQSPDTVDSIFNQLVNFDLIKNSAVDVMHDLLEGVCQYDLSILLHHFIYVEKILTLHELNHIIKTFVYDINDRNHPQSILESHLKSGRIIMSSSEMLCIIRNLPLMIAHYFPDDNDHWELFLNLKNLVAFLTSPVYHSNAKNICEVLVEEYLSERIRLFSSIRLVPKHHFLVHYASIIEKVGPLWNISCMKYESNHQFGKKVSDVSLNRINICYTIALRSQLQLNYRFLRNEGIISPFTIGPKLKKSYNKFPQIIHQFFPKIKKFIDITKWIKKFHAMIKPSSVIVIHTSNGPLFHYIDSLIYKEDQKVLILCKKSNKYFYNIKFDAFEIENNLSEQDWVVLKLEDIMPKSVIISSTLKARDNKEFISKTWF